MPSLSVNLYLQLLNTAFPYFNVDLIEYHTAVKSPTTLPLSSSITKGGGFLTQNFFEKVVCLKSLAGLVACQKHQFKKNLDQLVPCKSTKYLDNGPE